MHSKFAVKRDLTFKEGGDLSMTATESASIGEFIDAVWLEDGLAANTLAAYRLDLIGFEEWLR